MCIRDSYTVDQIVEIYRLMSKLGGPYGIIRQTEFFVYSEKDREALRRCQELGLKFPEITTWIRANKEDFKLSLIHILIDYYEFPAKMVTFCPYQ